MADQHPQNHHCRDCGLYFDSNNSLEVHLQYHKENLLSKWAATSSATATNSGEESNNNVSKQHQSQLAQKTQKILVPADSSDAIMDKFSPNFNYSRTPTPNSYFQSPEMRPPSVKQENNSNFNTEEPTYILGSGSGFPRRTPTPSSSSPIIQSASSSAYRYHPYQQQSSSFSSEHKSHNGRTSSPRIQQTPVQCDKCGFICENSNALMDHLQNSHASESPSNFSFSADFNQRGDVKIEPQSEILDLDSHKVHVYQPQEGEENSNSNMFPWMENMHNKKLFQPVQPNLNGSVVAQSPDFNVTTTTMNPVATELHQPYQFDHLNQVQPHQITSSQMPLMQKNVPLQKSAGGWKSNEARRPKTYNCTACNKWFTSSGHLKRHYNTTLHKNAVKQSGVTDPATLPISSHHHPQKDPNYQQASPVSHQVEEQGNLIPTKLEEHNNFDRATPQQNINFLPSPPNSLAGPSEITGGLLLHTSQPYHQTPQASTEDMRSVTSVMPTHHQNYLHHFPPVHAYPPHEQASMMYPNFQPPHVFTTQQQITNNNIGNLDVLEQQIDLQQVWGRNGDLKSFLVQKTENSERLPSFSHITNNISNLHTSFTPFANLQVVNSTDTNVGGLHSPPVSTYESLYSSSPINNDFNSVDSNSFGSSNDVNQNCDSNEFKTFNEEFIDYPSSTEDAIQKNVKNTIKLEENCVSSTIDQSSPPQSQSPIHRCHDCDKTFNKACYLTQHNKSFHTGDKPFKCEKCGKRFEDEHLLKEHLRKHAGDKPHKCDICPKQFNHKTDLRRHMCLHTGDKPYACSYCGKGFIRKDHMIKHCDTHKRKQNLGHARINQQQKRVIEPIMIPVPVQVIN